MKERKFFAIKTILLAFFALMLCAQAIFAQEALTSVKINVQNVKLSGDLKTISYDVYLQNVNTGDTAVAVMDYLFRMIVPQADIGTNAKTVTVTNATTELGVTAPTMTVTGTTNWLMKFQSANLITSYATALLISKTSPGTRVGTFNITNTDGTVFANPQTFTATYAGTTASRQSTVSIFVPNTTDPAPNSAITQPETNFTGLGTYSLTATTTQLSVSAPTITTTKVYDGTTTTAVTAGTLSGVATADVGNVTLNATAVYDNPTVGTGKTITVTYSLSGSAAGSYTAPASYSVTTGVINAVQLTASAPTITVSKAYDGVNTAAVTAGTLSGVLAADVGNVTLDATATYNNANVGTGKTITVSYSLSGTSTSNYAAPTNYSVTTGVITALSLTASAPTITSSKTYDGTTTAAVTAGTLSGLLPADVGYVTLTATGTYDNANIGTGKTITVTHSLSGTVAGNYIAPVSTSIATGVITTKALTVSAPTITLSKAYDGTTTATVTAGTLSGVATADVANVALTATATYDNATVGSGKTITVSYGLSGTASGNYTAPTSSSVTTGVITTKALTASAPTITLSKTYDATNSAVVTAGTLSGVVTADVGNVTLTATATYSNANVGSGKTITVTYSLSGTAASSYTAPANYSVTTGVITSLSLTASVPTITLSKTYDGTTTAAVTAGTLSGVLSADVGNVTLSVTATYNNTTVGTGKTITVTYSLSGTAAGSYTAPTNYSVTTGVITALQLTASAPTITLSKTYDGTTTAAVTAGTLSGVLSADAANVTLTTTGTYDNATVATGKTITVTYSLSGTAASNYTAPVNYSVTTGIITTKALTVSVPTITLSKVYDGTTDAVVTAGTLSGVATADVGNVTLTATATYSNANVGSGKTITVTYSLSGTAASSYVAPTNYSVTTGVITALQLTASAPTVTLSKVYDATTSATVTAGTLSGVLSADASNVTLTATGAYASSAVGTGKTITVTHGLSGTAAGNYTAPTSTSVTSGVITALQLTASTPTITLSKTYDANTTAAVTAGTLSGVLSADAANVTLTATGTYDNATVGTGKTITVTYSLSGSAAGNYTAPTSYSVTTGVITVSAGNQLTISNPTITLTKPYDGTNTATVVAGTLSGVATADVGNVTVTATATYSNANVGTGKTITVTYSLNGSAASNYLAPASYSVTTGVITALQLTTSAPTITLSKTYDANTTAAVTAGTLSGVLSADASNVTLTATGAYASSAVGTAKTITVTYNLSGTAAGNYTAPTSNSVTTGVILALQLTASAPTIALSKTYDANTTATVTAGTLSGVATADVGNVTLNATGTYDNANVGTGKTITVTYSLSGSAAGNYTAPTSYSVTTGVITVSAGNQLTISNPTITLTKPYDGTNTATVVAGTLSGVATADVGNVTVTATATYSNANVGTGKTITVTYSLSGTAAGNYIAPVSYSVTTGVITALQLTASVPTVTLSKVYDATTSATVTAGTLSGVLSADVANVTLTATANYATSTVGTGKAITVTYNLSGSAASNYTAPVNTIVTGIITAKALSVSAPTITLSKIYDANTSAAVIAGTLSGVITADIANVTLSAIGTYDNANVGTGKTITVTYSLSGLMASNYTAPTSTSVTTGVILSAGNQLTISTPTITLSKPYDGTNTATVVVGTLSGVATADVGNVTVTATALYNNVNVGTGKTITVTYSLSGTAASGYIAPTSYSVTTGVITALQLTASAPTITLSKVYDATTSAAVTAGTLSGVLSADVGNVTLIATADYTTSTAGTGKAIAVTYTLSGTAASNYTAPVGSITTGTITAKALSVSAPTITLSKAYDANTTAAVTVGTLSGVLSADTTNVTLSATGTYNNASIGIGKTITVTYRLSGTAAGNYLAPKDSVVTNGIITGGNIILSQMDSISVGCEGSSMSLSYNIQNGVPTQYKLTFSDAAHTAGIKDIAYTNLPSSATNGTITFEVPSGTVDGTYQGTLVVRDASETDSSSYNFSFTVNVSTDYIVQMYYDVLTCNNKDNRFTAYQWYKDGVAISGATKQFYYESNGLNGSYSVKLTTTDGLTLYTCEKGIVSSSLKSANVYPNPVTSNQVFTVTVSGFAREELENATLSIYAINGSCVYQSTKVENLNTINLSLLPQVYVGHLKISGGSDYEFKVIVQK